MTDSQKSAGSDHSVAQPTETSPKTQPSSHPGEPTLIGGVRAGGAPETSLMLGSTLGPYKLLTKLGEGGMGAVYKAQHTRLDKVVAIKVLADHLTKHAASVARFDREMKAVGKIDHPNIVRAMDAGEVNGTHYLAMEYVEGTDLSQLVRDRGTLPVVQACKAIRQAALALAAAHAVGLVHRDIKPANLLLAKTGQIKLLDLGLALLGDEAGANTELTTAGQTFGTPDYMAPEQWEDAHAADARTDLYALGCTLFYLLVGHAPFGTEKHKTAMSKMRAHALDAIPEFPPTRSDIPEGVREIYKKLLAKSPDQRFQTANELAEALAQFSSSKSVLVATVVAMPAASPASGGRQPPDSSAVTKPYVANAASVGTDAGSIRHGNRKLLYTVGGAAFLILCGVIIITITNKDGTQTRIEVPDTSKVEITTDQASVGRQPSDASQASTGTTESGGSRPPLAKSGWHGWPKDAPKPAIAPFDAEQAKQHQAAWAKYLGVPVEYTNSIGMKFRLIPPGEFLMGSTPEESEPRTKIDPGNTLNQDFIRSESPKHKVTLTHPIYLGIHEVTQADYEKVMGKNPSYFSTGGAGKDAVARTDTTQHPVESVSWNDATEFCAVLSKREAFQPFSLLAGESVTLQEGTGYRLPTEAEWEYACRAGTTTRWWGENQKQDFESAGWFEKNSGGHTHPVGKLNSNPFGLHDTHGNVWEWVQDWWSPTYYNEFQTKTAVNPTGPAIDGSIRVLRGIDSHYGSAGGGASIRGGSGQAIIDRFFGFRVALTVDAVRDARKAAGTSATNVVATMPTVPAAAPIDFATELQVAEWVLEKDGSVTVENSKKWSEHKKGEPLSGEPFVVRIIGLHDAKAVTDADVARIARCQFVEDVTLLNAKSLTVNAIPIFAQMPRLKTLNLSAPKVPTSALEGLRQSSTLEYLRITGDMVDDGGKVLQQLPTLRKFHIYDWRPKQPDLSLLSEAKQLCTLELALPGTPNRDQLLELQAKHGRLRITVGQENLVSVGNDLVHEAAKVLIGRGVECFGRHLLSYDDAKRLTAADLADGYGWAVEARKIPAGVQLTATERELLTLLELQHFVVVGQKDSDLLAQSLAQCREIASITMQDCDLTDAGLAHLQKLGALRNAILQKVKVTPAGIERFHQALPGAWVQSDFGNSQSSQKLAMNAWSEKSRGLEPSKPVTTPPTAPASALVDFAAEREAAEWVLANNGAVTIEVADDPQQLWTTLKQENPLPKAAFIVRYIDLKQSQVKSDEDLARLVRCQYLESLTLHGANGGDRSIELLGQIPAIANLSLAHHKSLRTSAFRGLSRIPNLTHFDITPEMIDDRLEFVRHLPTLRSLNVYGPQPPDITLLAEAPHLRTVLLTTPDSVDDEKLAAVQARHGRLRIVVGWQGKYRVVGRDPVHEAAKHMVQLGVEVNGGANYWKPRSKLLTRSDLEDGSVWSFDLPNIPSKVQLTAADREKLELLDSYHFTAEGQHEADELAKVLSVKHGIVTVNLPNSDLTDAGLEHLKKLVGLRGIILSKTKVTQNGVEQLRRALPRTWITSDFGVFPPSHRLAVEPKPLQKAAEPVTSKPTAGD